MAHIERGVGEDGTRRNGNVVEEAETTAAWTAHMAAVTKGKRNRHLARDEWQKRLWRHSAVSQLHAASQTEPALPLIAEIAAWPTSDGWRQPLPWLGQFRMLHEAVGSPAPYTLNNMKGDDLIAWRGGQAAGRVQSRCVSTSCCRTRAAPSRRPSPHSAVSN